MTTLKVGLPIRRSMAGTEIRLDRFFLERRNALKSGLIVVSVAFGAWQAGATAQAAIYTSSFTSDAMAWTGVASHSQVASGGALDNGGYLAVNRSGGDPLANAGNTTRDNTLTAGVFVGDLLARYGGGLGNQMDISLYHKDFSLTPASNINLALLFSSDANDTFIINPPNAALDPQLSSAEWRQLKLTVNLDSGSPPAGWVHSGSGSLTWAQVMQNVTQFRIQTWGMENNNQQLGLDEITFATVSVPEPGSALLFAIGAMVLVTRRRLGKNFAH